METIPQPKDAGIAGINASELLERTVANLSEAILVVNPATRSIVSCNKAAEEIFGYSCEEIIGRNTEFLHVDRERYEEFGKELSPTLDANGVFHKEFMMRRRDGSVFPTEHTVTEICDEAGNRVGVVSSVRDITDRIAAEREIKLQRDNFMRILNAVTDGIYIVNRDCDIEYINPVIEREFGKVKGRKCYTYFHDRKEQCPWCKNKEVFSGKSVRWEWSSPKTGKTYDLLDMPIANPDGSVSKFEIFHDITERKRVEDDLRESEERYRNLFENNHAVMLLINPIDGAIVDANPAAVAYYGWPKEALTRKNIAEINTLTPDQVHVEMALARAEKRNHFIFRHRRAHDEPRDVEVYSGSIKAYGKDLLYSIIFDITDRKLAEEKLAKSEERFRILSENASDLIYHVRLAPDMAFEYVSPSAERLVGYTPEEHYADPFLGMKIVHPDDRALLRDMIGKRMFGHPVELRWIHKDGHVVWMEQVNHPTYSKDGVLVGITGAARDITERKRLENRLKDQLDRLSSAQRIAKVGDWTWNVKTGAITWSDEIYRLFGLDKTFVPTLESYAGLIHPDDLHLLSEDSYVQQISNSSHETEYRIIAQDTGKTKYVLNKGNTVFGEDGKPEMVKGTLQDITERKLAEEALIRSEAKYRALTEQAVDGIFIFDQKARFLDGNPATQELSGYTLEELQAISITDLIAPEDLKTNPIKFAEIMTGQTVASSRTLRRKDGSLFTAELTSKLMPDGNILGTARDITERKRAEEALRQNEELLRNYFDLGQVGMAITSLDQKWLRVNDRLCEILGYAKDELTRMTWTELTHPDDLEPDLAQFRRLLAGEIERYEMDKRFVHKNGNIVYTHLTVACQRNPDRSVEYVIASVADITERKRAEDELKRFFNLVPDMVCIASTEGYFLKINPMWEATLGYSEQEILSTPFLDFIHPDDRDATMNEVARQIGGDATMHFVNRYRCKDGGYKWLEWMATPSPDKKQLFAAAYDITERKRAEEALHETHALLDEVQEISKLGGWKYESSTGKVTWTDEVYRIHGVGKDYDPGTANNDIKFYSPDDQKVIEEAFKKAVTHGEPYDLELQLDRVDGKRIWVRTTGRPLIENGKIVRVTGNIMDITERKLAEEGLRKSEERYRGLIEHIEVAVVVHAADTSIKTINNKALELLGITADQAMGRTSYDPGWRFLEETGDAMPLNNYPVNQVMASQKPLKDFVVGVNRPSTNDFVWVIVNAIPIFEDENIKEIIVSFTDITERKRAELALAQSEWFMRTLTDTIPGMVGYWTDELRCTFANKGYLDWFGKTPEQMRGIRIQDLMGEDLFRKNAPFIRAALRGESQNFERTLVKADGSVGYMWAHYIPDFDGERVRGFFVLVSNITELKKAELALAQSELNYRTVANFTNDWETWREPDGRFRYVSPSCEHITGYPPERFLSDPDFLPSIIHPQDIGVYNNHIETSHKLAGSWQTKEHGQDRVMFRIIRKDGETRWIEHVCQRVFDENGVWLGARGSNRDMTDLVTAREQAEAATKLKDKFVSLVAHDLRSPFTSMMGLLKHFAMRNSFLEDEENKKIFDLVFKNGDRMLAMIEDLLKIGRLQSGKITLQPKFFKGYVAVAVTIGSISHNASQKGIEIINDVPVDMRLYADQSLFDEVLLNLLSNAIKFCSRGDKITVFTPPGLKSAIAVRDTGKGVNEKQMPNLFRHEVTTSTPGTAGELGTGLGLPYSYDIMKAHGGDITVESAPGKGSVFCAMLPYVRPIALVVDDDPMALLVVRSHLEKIHIEVMEAASGEQALSAMKDRRPHIIITDIVMSGMDGFALLDRLKQDSATSGIPVIAMTSFNGDTREKAFRHGADDFVSKPIEVGDFIPRVRRFVG